MTTLGRRPYGLLFAAVFACAGCGKVVGLTELTFDREPACTSHAECSDAHLTPSICRNSRCASLTNYQPLEPDPNQRGDCRVVLGADNLRAGFEPFVLGAFANIDPAAPESTPAVLNYKLAVQEFSNHGGIPIAGESRLPVVVVCNSNVEAERLERSFDHLVDALGVRATIAAITDAGKLKSSFEHVRRKAKDVFFLSPFSSTSALTSIHDDDLLWHLLPNMLQVAPAYLPLVNRIEDYINPALPGEPRTPLRVALVVASDFSKLDELGSFLDEQLRFNGKSTKENGPDHYLRVNVNYGPSDPNADLTEALRQLQEFEPSIVVSAAGPELLTDIVPPLEQAWGDTERPFYVMSPYEINDALLGLARYESRYQLRQRIVGVNVAAARDPTLYEEYLDRLKVQFPAKSQLESTENYYDAPYLLLYAASAGGQQSENPTGAEIATGMHRLLAGMPYDVGPKDLVDALGYLADDQSRSITLQGTLGPPDFDVDGGRRGTGSIWCLDESVPGSGVPQWKVHFDVFRYEPNDSTLTGSFPCFEGF